MSVKAEMYESQVFTVCMRLFYYLLEINLNQEALF